MSEDLEHAWKIKEYISQNIQFSDSKASGVIAISTLSVALLSFLPKDVSQVEAIVIALSSLILLISIIFALLTFFPRTYPRPSSGTIFWGNISELKQYQHYERKFKQSNKLDEVLKQIYSIATIANNKYIWVSRAIQLQAVGLVVFWLVILGVIVF